MQTMIDMPECDRRELGRRMRQNIVSRFDLYYVLNRYELLYRQLLAAKPRPTRFRHPLARFAF
jgi:hypothetical protein